MDEENEELGSIPFDLTDTDRENLQGGDEKFKPHHWEDLKQIIGGTIDLHRLLLSLRHLSVQRRAIYPSSSANPQIYFAICNGQIR